MSLLDVRTLKTEPVVGRYYLVPTAIGKMMASRGGDLIKLPVLGPRHEDEEHLGFKPLHWHYDARFITEAMKVATAMPTTQEEKDGWTFAETVATLVLVTGEYIGLTRMRCIRKQFRYPFEHIVGRGGTTFRGLWDAYEGSPCATGPEGELVCPHRGLVLDSLPQQDGLITCPLHGLKVDPDTRTVVRSWEWQ